MRTLLLLLLFSAKLFAQGGNYIDSVKTLTNSKVDTIRFWAYSELAWVLKETDKENALIYSKKLHEEGKIKKLPKWEAQGLNDMAIIYIKSGDLKNAESSLLQSLAIRKKIGFKPDIASSLSKIGQIKLETSKYSEAVIYFLEALKIYEGLNNEAHIAYICNNVGQSYNNLKNYTMSKKYLARAYSINKKTNNKPGLAITYACMGNNFSDEKKNDSALYSLGEAAKLFKEIGSYGDYATTLNNMGHIYRANGEVKKSLDNYLQALEISKEVKDSSGICIFLNSSANAYIVLGRFNEAEKNLFEALAITEKLGQDETKLKLYNSLTILYIKKLDAEKASIYFDKYTSARDQIFSKEAAKEFTEAQTKFDVEKKDLQLAKNQAEFEIQKKQNLIKNAALIIGLFVTALIVAFSVLLFKRYKVSQLQKKLIEHQKQIVDEKQKEIIDSITYAKRLQQAILPPDSQIKTHLPNSFILYKPKDIVAGDFYWMEHINDLILFAAADCTGHGVPGAMVSVVCSNALNRAVKEFNILDPGKILDKVRELVVETFEKSEQEVKDGMDISLCCLNKKTNQLLWAGANNPLWIVRREIGDNRYETGSQISNLTSNVLLEYKADKQPIGKFADVKSFTTHQIQLQKNDELFIFTDGYADQFGGVKGKKFKTSNMKTLFNSIKNLPLEEQKIEVENAFENWRGDLEQVDDVCVIGVRV
ncbi:MAG: tetratricopeptide repeat protein [Bacteroidota bacterium]